jgi:hypothetical protein
MPIATTATPSKPCDLINYPEIGLLSQQPEATYISIDSEMIVQRNGPQPSNQSLFDRDLFLKPKMHDFYPSTTSEQSLAGSFAFEPSKDHANNWAEKSILRDGWVPTCYGPRIVAQQQPSLQNTLLGNLYLAAAQPQLPPAVARLLSYAPDAAQCVPPPPALHHLLLALAASAPLSAAWSRKPFL